MKILKISKLLFFAAALLMAATGYVQASDQNELIVAADTLGTMNFDTFTRTSSFSSITCRNCRTYSRSLRRSH